MGETQAPPNLIQCIRRRWNRGREKEVEEKIQLQAEAELHSKEYQELQEKIQSLTLIINTQLQAENNLLSTIYQGIKNSSDYAQAIDIIPSLLVLEA